MTDYKVTGLKKNELDRFLDISADAFQVRPEERKTHRKLNLEAGLSNFRVVRAGGKIVGGLVHLHWGNFFGGKSVPSVGIAEVCVVAEYRRKGAATFLMNETVRELYKRGIPLSALFPATIPLYRKSGYECAMDRCIFRVQPKTITIRDTPCELVPYEGKSRKIFKDAWNRFAIRTNGNIDRNDLLWNRVFSELWSERRKYTIRRGKKVDGYLIAGLDKKRKNVWLADWTAFSPGAVQAILNFIAVHSTQDWTAEWTGSDKDILAMSIPDRSFEINRRDNGMLRIVSVPDALEKRGYPAGVDVEVNFEVTDDVVPDNNGRFLLTVKNGVGHVKKGGDGSVRIDIRTLAQLYTGYMAPGELCLSGILEAPEKDLADMELVFSGPHPWIRDDF